MSEEELEEAPEEELEDEAEEDEPDLLVGRNIVEEREYKVPLSQARAGKNPRRTNRAVRELTDFLKKHMKTDMVTITQDLNEELWSHGIRDPPRAIKVRVARTEEGEVLAFPA